MNCGVAPEPLGGLSVKDRVEFDCGMETERLFWGWVVSTASS